MAPSIAFTNSDRIARDQAKEDVSEIAASIASLLAESRAGRGAVSTDAQDEQVIAANEHDCACEGARLDETNAPKQVVLSQDRLPISKPSADEYRGRVDACLKWAREASTDEVRLACLTLAQAWLKAAMSQGGDVSDRLPLAPTL